ncbi:hypothetical protein IJ670_05225, partial [bacterium]|nr:hypothetical protein [bacterium]
PQQKSQAQQAYNPPQSTDATTSPIENNTKEDDEDDEEKKKENRHYSPKVQDMLEQFNGRIIE